MRPRNRHTFAIATTVAPASLAAAGPASAQSFVNWESAHVHPVDLTPDGRIVVAANTPDNRVEVFRVNDANTLTFLYAIPVGLDPVSVRARTTTEIWVVNWISDTISIVDLTTRTVVDTIEVADEPGDVVFTDDHAFISMGTANEVWRYSIPYDAAETPTIIPIEGEEPRAMAVANGVVSVNIFTAADTTVAHVALVGGPDNPYGQGVNPPPNDGNTFNPPINPVLLEDNDGDGEPDNPPPFSSMMLKQNEAGQWMDDNAHDWSGAVFWDLHHHAMAHIDVDSLNVTYTTRLMSTNIAIAASPVDGRVASVGINANNHIRFEPNLNGRFATMGQAVVDPVSGTTTLARINPHLADFTPDVQSTDGVQALAGVEALAAVAVGLRSQSLGDPQGVAWTPDGGALLITGRGTDNVVKMTPAGARLDRVDGLPSGPTGIVHAADLPTAYVVSRFDGSISVLRTDSMTVEHSYSFHDPTPDAVQAGRPLLYNTNNSLFGTVACGTCHLNSHFDGRSWDLGDPSGDMMPFVGECLSNGCIDSHPMKGPMFTQSLRNLEDNQPFHWRGDRPEMVDFRGAFASLLGGTEPSDTEMQQFEDMLFTVHFPPNPYRLIDGTLADSHPIGGNPQRGLLLFETSPNGGGPGGGGPVVLGELGHVMTAEMLADAEAIPIGGVTPPGGGGGGGGGEGGGVVGLGCVGCHAFPTGSNHKMLRPFPGQGLTSINHSTEVAPLESAYFKDGFDTAAAGPIGNGIGQFHHGGIDTLVNFLVIFFGGVTTEQDRLDIASFLFSFGVNTHAGVGEQVTIGGNDASPIAFRDQMIAVADSNAVGLVAKGVYEGERRGFAYTGGGSFQSDRAAEVVTLAQLDAAAGAGEPITYTLVPAGTETRIGIDRDEDGFLDQDEIDDCANHADPTSTPNNACCGDFNRSGNVGFDDLTALLATWGDCRVADPCTTDLTSDLSVGFDDLTRLLSLWGPCPLIIDPGDPVEEEKILEGGTLPAP